MSLFTKFIAGGLGFVLGGPLGLLIGLMFESTIIGTQKKEVSDNRRRAQATQADFRMSLLVLLAAVMRADNKVVKSELTVVKQFLIQTFGEQSAMEGLQILKKLLDQHIEVDPIAVQIGYNLNASSKLQLIHMLYKVADADGAIVPQEAQLIERIARLMRVPVSDFNSVKAMFTTRTRSEEHTSELQSHSDISYAVFHLQKQP